jgi:hypothetical protein
MRCYQGPLFALFLAVALALLGATIPSSAGGPVGTLYLDLQDPGFRQGIPGNCSTWHELYPAFCAPHHQDDYDDADGDGEVSVCDTIKLNGIDYHVVWVGPTYHTTCSDQPGGPPLETAIFDVQNLNPEGNPICEIWHEVYPEFCHTIHIDSWIDNGDGVLSVCDIVDTNTPEGTRFYHIDQITLDIIVEPGTVSVEKSTWGKIKNFFRR